MPISFPITWPDKVNNPELLAALEAYGEEHYLKAEEINLIRDVLNFLYANSPTTIVFDTVLYPLISVTTFTLIKKYTIPSGTVKDFISIQQATFERQSLPATSSFEFRLSISNVDNFNSASLWLNFGTPNTVLHTTISRVCPIINGNLITPNASTGVSTGLGNFSVDFTSIPLDVNQPIYIFTSARAVGAGSNVRQRFLKINAG